jgi:hypothetical protein
MSLIHMGTYICGRWTCMLLACAGTVTEHGPYTVLYDKHMLLSRHQGI